MKIITWLATWLVIWIAAGSFGWTLSAHFVSHYGEQGGILTCIGALILLFIIKAVE